MIKRIKIRDFKSIRDLDFDLDSVTVLVGRSGTGKSNLVQAIRFLRNLLLAQNEAIQNEGGWERIVPATGPLPKPTFELWFSLPGDEGQYNYKLMFGLPGMDGAQQQYNRHQIVLREERLSLAEEVLFFRCRTPQGVWEWKQAPKTSPLPPNQDELALGLMPSLPQVVYAHAALTTGIGYYDFSSATLTPRDRPFQSTALQARMPGLLDNGQNYLAVMKSILQDFHRPAIRKDIFASLQRLNPSIVSVELDALLNPNRAVVGHRAGDHVFSLSLDQESDGFRRFYAHLLALYQTPSKLILAFEEPENGIFPGALSLLADEFKDAAGAHRGQVILTTHNPLFLDSFDVENVRAVDMRDGKTMVTRVAKDQRQAVKDRLLTTGELLTVDLVRLDDGEPPQPP